MKKLLSIFTTVSLLTPTVNTIISCNKAHKYIPDDDSNNIGNDIEIMNNINARVKKHLDEWWKAKAKIDITKYPDQVEKFKELVTSLKTNDDQVLTGAAIREWRFLDQLYTGFETEFNNLNYEIKNEYSNYYINTMPLSLDSNDISFTLQNINFDNLALILSKTLDIYRIYLILGIFLIYRGK
ncbi:lipoprotein [Spiroplasma endosymbiont of Stenodema calcarata]|uniref:lipoprotein n=1 Tax=Spiroplasma endosymbiont of Stenodema calcarata TaxID=3139328 RepID=UPI003CCB3BCF